MSEDNAQYWPEDAFGACRTGSANAKGLCASPRGGGLGAPTLKKFPRNVQATCLTPPTVTTSNLCTQAEGDSIRLTTT